MTEKSATISATSAIHAFTVNRLIFQSKHTKPSRRCHTLSGEKLFSIIFLRTKFAFILKRHAANNATNKKKWTMDFVGIRNSRTPNIRWEKKCGKNKVISVPLWQAIHLLLKCTHPNICYYDFSDHSSFFSLSFCNNILLELYKSALTTSWLLLSSFRYFFLSLSLFSFDHCCLLSELLTHSRT